ncbi:MAG: homoserine dehydrogenase [Xanthomonadales bacterium]|nr:homoserine dehydrogenase [Xanthomonadales bacterium]
MSAVLAGRFAPHVAATRAVLLGTGGVGRALLRRFSDLQGRGLASGLNLVGVANSRCGAVDAALAADQLAAHIDGLDLPGSIDFADRAFAATAAVAGRRVVIDATASDAVAGRHAHWLAQGIDVVTANKLGQGASLLRWQAIRAAQTAGRARYGDAATVGAGLPFLRSIRALVAGGDRIDAISGVLSGSLAWLFDRFDGTRPFSALVREARDLGYTEPDPREDLSGCDVRRKLLILARAAGIALDEQDVQVSPLLDATLAEVGREQVDATLPRLDAPLHLRLDAARSRGARLRVVARWHAGGASVGLEALAADDELAGGSGTDNRLVLHSTRYRDRPLQIQGPGAGTDITAAALLDEVLEIAVA